MVAHEESSDSETHVGAAVALRNAKTNRFFKIGAATTFSNGAKGLPSTRPDKYKYIVHAEQNLIYLAAKHGYSLSGVTVFCTLSPCQACLRALWQAGVTTVYYRERYRDHNPNMDDLNVVETEEGEYTKIEMSNK